MKSLLHSRSVSTYSQWHISIRSYPRLTDIDLYGLSAGPEVCGLGEHRRGSWSGGRVDEAPKLAIEELAQRADIPFVVGDDRTFNQHPSDLWPGAILKRRSMHVLWLPYHWTETTSKIRLDAIYMVKGNHSPVHKTYDWDGFWPENGGPVSRLAETCRLHFRIIELVSRTGRPRNVEDIRWLDQVALRLR